MNDYESSGQERTDNDRHTERRGIMDPPEPLIWEQRDACRLRCTACGQSVQIAECDLHLARCPEQ